MDARRTVERALEVPDLVRSEEVRQLAAGKALHGAAIYPPGTILGPNPELYWRVGSVVAGAAADALDAGELDRYLVGLEGYPGETLEALTERSRQHAAKQPDAVPNGVIRPLADAVLIAVKRYAEQHRTDRTSPFE